MKFTRIELGDIFAYRGRSEIKLSECTPTANIVVVQGPNGAGKTSLLNAIKLLFVGADDTRMRRVIQGQAAIPQKQFVLGNPGRWYGVINRHAREDGRPAFVAIEWENEGLAYRAERRFTVVLGGADYAEELTVTVDGTSLQAAAAAALMQTLLPREVTPFFFFDGEQIQSLADAEFGREQAEIERLLGLSYVGLLTREITTFANLKKSAGLPLDARAEIARAEGELAAAEAEAEAAAKARVEIEEERLELERQKTAADAERNRLRGGLSDQERQRMEARIAVVSQGREKTAAKVAAQVPPLAPVYANLDLVTEVFRVLDGALTGAADASLTERLHHALPEQLIAGLANLEPPVELEEAQQVGFRREVASALNASGVAPRPVSNPVLNSLSPRDLKALRDQFHVWSNAGRDVVGVQVGHLRELRVLLREERSLRRDLHEAEITSEEARERFAVLTEEIEGLDHAINGAVARATAREIEETGARKEAAERTADIARLYDEYEDRVKQNKAYQLARQAKLALEAYRDERRKQIRASVESRLKHNIQILLARSQLVRDVVLDDRFSLTYLDAEGEPVARHSLSAGMRQLAAMAMLWALKEEAERPIPVVIDTPLGRIDVENRNLLLDEYFPRAGNPLILLPTNSEVDPQVYDALRVHVAKRYVIDNKGGTSATLVERPLTGPAAS